MTPLAPLITSFLRDYMPRQRGYSPQTCETYAVSFKLLLEYAATRTRTRPSRLSIEQLDAPLVVDFLAHIERDRGKEQPTRPQSSGVQVPVPPIACRRAVSISDARGGNEPRSART
jgi:hypothetical protein